MTPNNNIYFKGLNKLRAIAAIFVLIHHNQVYKRDGEIQSLYPTILVLLANGMVIPAQCNLFWKQVDLYLRR